jgi:signal transduction histidine kinase
LPVVSVDRPRIVEVLQNLIDNAIRYSNKNGEIKISLFKENEIAIIRVSDNGRGISAEDLPCIFDRFYQADKSRGTEGSGLGLSIVKWIVEAHKGTIDVESKLSQGSTFTAKLPIK